MPLGSQYLHLTCVFWLMLFSRKQEALPRVEHLADPTSRCPKALTVAVAPEPPDFALLESGSFHEHGGPILGSLCQGSHHLGSRLGAPDY